MLIKTCCEEMGRVLVLHGLILRFSFHSPDGATPGVVETEKAPAPPLLRLEFANGIMVKDLKYCPFCGDALPRPREVSVE